MGSALVLGWGFVALLLYRLNKLKEVGDFYRGFYDVMKSAFKMQDLIDNDQSSDSAYGNGACTAGAILMVAGLAGAIALVATTIVWLCS